MYINKKENTTMKYDCLFVKGGSNAQGIQR
jgi:hypothetical protein